MKNKNKIKEDISRIKRDHIPVVMPAFHMNHLGVIRGLGMEGITSIAIDDHPDSCCFYSKYCIPYLCPNPKENEDKILDLLFELGGLLPEKGVLIIQEDFGDPYLNIVLKNINTLKDYYIFTMNYDKLKEYNDKKFQVINAKKSDFFIPETWFIDEINDLEEIKDDLTFPCIIKARITKDIYKKFGIQTFIVNSLFECEDKLDKLKKHVPLIIQEQIPGEDNIKSSNMVTLGTCLDKNSNPLGIFTGKKLRNVRLYGSCSLAESCKIPEIVGPGLKFLKKIGYVGCSEIECKLDPRDERYKFIELNARLWKWHSLATACNVNLIYKEYMSAIGEKIGNVLPKQINGKIWWLSLRDTWISLNEIKKGNMTKQDFLKGLKQNYVDAFHDWNDPWPGLINFKSLKWMS